MVEESDRVKIFVQELMAVYRGMGAGLRNEIEGKEATATKIAFLVGAEATLLVLNRRLEDMALEGEFDLPVGEMVGRWDSDQSRLAAVLIGVIRVSDRLFNIELSKEGWEKLWKMLGEVERKVDREGH